MMKDLQIFKSDEFGEVRTTTINNDVWFVGKDVAEILGYKNGSRDINRHVDEEDITTKNLPQYQNGTLVSKTILINESGLYSLILRSNLPKAKKFKRWVTSEVLPSIRKHGMYATDELLDNPDLFISVLQELKQARLDNKVKDQQIIELQPKATYYDLILQTPDLISISVIAKDYGMSGRALNKILNQLGIQYKQSSIWLLYAKFQDKGYTSTKTSNYVRNDGTQGSSVHTYWTQKGRLFLYEKLKSKGFLPIIEQNYEQVCLA